MDLRIVFMGTPDFAVASLDRLLTKGYEVVGVVTAVDKPAGRGRKLQQSAVKKYALEKGLKVLQPVNLKGEDFLRDLKSLEADLQVVVAFRMLPREVWEMPKYGTFNLHASLLPNYRGAAPINWAIINGEVETGVTTFFIDEKIDTGAILLHQKAIIGPDESAGSLHDRLMELGADLVVQTVELIAEGKASPTPQQEPAALKPAPKIQKEDCRVSWDNPLHTVYNHIRGLSPYPAAWSILRNGEEELGVKIFRAQAISAGHKIKPGTILAGKDRLQVAVRGGYIELMEVQLAGKRRMVVKELLNGLLLKEGAYMM